MTDDEFVCAEFGIIDFYDIDRFAPDPCQREILAELHLATDGLDYTDNGTLRRSLLKICRRHGIDAGFNLIRKGDRTVPYSWEHLDFVSKVRVKMWCGRKDRAETSTEGAKLAFPAFELVLVRSEPDSAFYVEDLDKRWHLAGKTCEWEGVVMHPDRMIATVDSPIWRTLGDGEVFDDGLGIDYPPFYINGGWLFGWRDIEFDDFKKLLAAERHRRPMSFSAIPQ